MCNWLQWIPVWDIYQKKKVIAKTKLSRICSKHLWAERKSQPVQVDLVIFKKRMCREADLPAGVTLMVGKSWLRHQLSQPVHGSHTVTTGAHWFLFLLETRCLHGFDLTGQMRDLTVLCFSMFKIISPYVPTPATNRFKCSYYHFA